MQTLTNLQAFETMNGFGSTRERAIYCRRTQEAVTPWK